MKFNHYYKEVVDGIVMCLHGCNKLPEGKEEITFEKYQELQAKFLTKPENTLEYIYRFVDTSESYEAFERTEEEKVQWYQEQVNTGTMTLEEVPETYKELLIIPGEETKSADYEEGYNQAVLDLIESGVL